MTEPAPDRIERMRAALTVALNPASLEIQDDSHLHAGHRGAREGKGHYTVQVVAAQFSGLRPLQRHQLVYKALADLMHSDIHALAIVALAPEEFSAS